MLLFLAVIGRLCVVVVHVFIELNLTKDKLLLLKHWLRIMEAEALPIHVLQARPT